MKIQKWLHNSLQSKNTLFDQTDSTNATWSDLKQGLCKNSWHKSLSIVAGIIIIGLSLYYLGRNMAPLLRDLSWVEDLRWEFAAVALILFTIGNLLGGVLWHMILKSMNQECPLGPSIWINTMAVLGKYIPGSAWQVAGRAYLTSRTGPDLKMVSSATVLDLATKTLTALLLSAALVPTSILTEALGIPEWIIITLASLALVAIIAIPYISRLGFVRSNRRLSSWLPIVSRKRYWLTCIAMTLTWAVNSAANAFLVQSFQNLTTPEWLLAAVSLPLSITVGGFTPFAPAGLGVREAVLAATLGSIVPTAIASAAAVASRLVMILADLIAMATVSLMGKRLAGDLVRITRKD